MHTIVNLDQVQRAGQELLAALIAYSVRQGAPRCYQNWSPETLQDYFCFHARQGTLTWAGEAPSSKLQAPRILGTAVAWQVDERVLRHADLSGGYRFAWEPQDRAGDCVFFGDVVCSSPAALVSLLASFGQRYPEWTRLKWFTYRRGKLVQLQLRHLNLFLRKTQPYVER
jgi:hypothetical protein